MGPDRPRLVSTAQLTFTQAISSHQVSWYPEKLESRDIRMTGSSEANLSDCHSVSQDAARILSVQLLH
jgi:hypothetical protein